MKYNFVLSYFLVNKKILYEKQKLNSICVSDVVVVRLNFPFLRVSKFVGENISSEKHFFFFIF